MSTISFDVGKGFVCTVEEADFYRLCTYNRRDGQVFYFVPADLKWKAASNRHNYYATASIKHDGRYIFLPLHRMVLDAPGNMFVDHINGDTMLNTRANLRLADARQNKANEFVDRGGASKYRGVRITPSKRRPWQAQIQCPGRGRYIGQFATEEEAARAYDVEAIKAFGSFARLNFPSEPVKLRPMHRVSADSSEASL